LKYSIADGSAVALCELANAIRRQVLCEQPVGSQTLKTRQVSEGRNRRKQRGLKDNEIVQQKDTTIYVMLSFRI